MITLGATAKDIITGFVGVTTGRAQYLTGCDQYLLNPSVTAAGERREPQWVDEQRLIVLIHVPVVTLDNSNGNGADVTALNR